MMSMDADSMTRYWGGERGLAHQTPPRKDPEGFDPGAYMARQFFAGPVLEFGCGAGRLAGAFLSSGIGYGGVDVSERAIAKARETHSAHADRFEVVRYNGPIPFRAPDGFAYTVLLHVPDELLPGAVARISEAVLRRFVVAEILGRHWRIPGQVDPPVFNREAHEYVEAFEAAGWRFSEMRSRRYEYYRGRGPGGLDEMIAFLVFDRAAS